MPFNSLFRVMTLFVIWFAIPVIVYLFYPAIAEHKEWISIIYHPLTAVVWFYWDYTSGFSEKEAK